MIPKNEKEALVDVDDRIQMLERRLDNAKAARDAFVHHLRGKYPNWTPPLPTMSYQEANFSSISTNNPTNSTNFPNREPLVSRLSTGDYQWDVDHNQGLKDRMWIRSRPLYRASYANPPMDIPTSGPLLESDIRRSRIRLREISEELRSMRIDRMNLSTDQWLQEQHFRKHKAMHLNFGPSFTEAPRVDPLDQAMVDLSRIDLTETMPMDTPTSERKVDMEMQEMFEKELAQRRAELEHAQRVPAPEPVVRFHEPITSVPVAQAPVAQAPVAPPSVAPLPLIQVPVAQAPVIAPPPVGEAPPPVVQAAPLAAQAPPSNSTISNLLSQITARPTKGLSDSEDDTPRNNFRSAPRATTSSSGLDYSAMMGGFKAEAPQFSDDDSEPEIPRLPVKKVADKKSNMYKNEDDDDFW